MKKKTKKSKKMMMSETKEKMPKKGKMPMNFAMGGKVSKKSKGKC